MVQTTHPTTEQGKQFTERRAERRQRVLKGGTIRFNKGYGAAQCTVRNLTQNGALLVFGETNGVPKTFDFELTNEKGLRPAKVAWRDLKHIGISFE